MPLSPLFNKDNRYHGKIVIVITVMSMNSLCNEVHRDHGRKVIKVINAHDFTVQ